MVVIMIGRKRSMQASKMESRESLPSLRSAASAKSIIMMAFFLTMPISRMMPIMAMMLRSVPVSISASSAPTPADGSVDRIVIGMDVALVENPEHDVDSHQGGGDQQRLAAERILVGLGGARETGLNGGRQSDFFGGRIDGIDRIAERHPGPRLNESVTAGNSPWCVTDRGAVRRRVVGERDERHRLARWESARKCRATSGDSASTRERPP